MINNVTLVGRLTRDPELRYTPTPPPSATQNNQKQSSPADSHDPFADSEPMNINNDDLPF